jgi:RNA polymerase sigma-70 factor (ECF subfamily)
MYYEQIYLFMRRLGHSFQVSEDLTQESFLQAWQHIGQLREGKALNGWIYRIAGNVSKLHWRRYKRREVAGIDGNDVPDNAEAGFEKSERNEQLAELRSAVGQLPMKLRQAVVLHYMQHLTIAEAAEAVGVSEGTLKSRLHRGLKALRKQLI